ncbi:tRNA (adenosine(37)-N6)-dimethylallyltransferase MiaA [Hydrogenobacter hydrogenophilus]|uniref:tRNA dimethylallyltransferase n=1 Tax=Hydrogenobacter hydrogenophilus TaxID=35835 RepID=A0A285P4X2_9AQUI|nr:tRNA (adenosine(37)-N6)-dimethylallyltransferase MiaA [Hydrogenobacter hydrogenophilus]SNZ16774.1 tRNA dimethylallyltransferase [Hydrogenobacter hydrogenophilus]
MLLVIGGPTASGKSSIACLVAQALNGEIISADSMSVYKYMDIGTAKPVECMKVVKHHLVDILEPGEVFDAKIFEEMSVKAIEDIKGRKKVPIVCGGTYLYIQALLYGIEETPPPDWSLRQRLYSIAGRKGSAYLYEKLKVVDKKYAMKISPQDSRRIVRALEVFLQTGRPFSSFHRWGAPRFEFKGFYTKLSWESLSRNIEKRVVQMLEKGLVDEVKKLLDMGFENFLTSQQAIGYKELIPYLKGLISLEEAVKNIVKNTKDYAKRQIRWFRRQGWEEVDVEKLGIEGSAQFILKKALDLDFLHCVNAP